MKSIKRFIPLVLIILLSTTAWFLGFQKYFTLEMLQSTQDTLDLYIQSYPILSFFVFAALYVVMVALSIPGAAFMTIIGGFLFGQWVGVLAVAPAATLGATFLFLSARLATGNIEKSSRDWVQKMQKGFQENAFFYLLTLRLIPLFPFVAINLAAAFLQIPLKTFFFGTFIGIIPGSFVYVSMGVALREVINTPHLSPNLVLEPKILMALIGLGILSLLPVLYKLIQKRQQSHSHQNHPKL